MDEGGFQYFKLDDFACSCCGENHIDPAFVRRLDQARAYAGIAFIVNSGYRCPKHNADVGSKTENHIQGLAADLKCHVGTQRLLMLHGLLKAGFRRIGVYPSFMHVDAMPNRPQSVWLK